MDDQPNITAPGEWVLLEVFGHRRHFGLLTEVERFGAKLARIDEFQPESTEPTATHFYGGASIFSITPITEASARQQVGYYRPAAVQSLPSPDEHDFFDDDEDAPL